MDEVVDDILRESDNNQFTIKEIVDETALRLSESFMIIAGYKWLTIYARRLLEKKKVGNARQYHNIIVDRQLRLWKPINELTREEAQASFRQRRKAIIDDCNSLARDVQHWNENVRKKDEKRIQLTLQLDL